MRFVFYTHSLISDWNHGNAHFLRGVMRDLVARGHDAVALEPEDSWSRQNLLREQGEGPLRRFPIDFPELKSVLYGPDFDHGAFLTDADVVIVHEWTSPEVVAQVGRCRRDGGRFTLLFHDTHHRAVSDSQGIASLMLSQYDAVLAFGNALRERYVQQGWGRNVFTWHEAADDRLFHPPARPVDPEADLVWIGNWGDGERSAELRTFLMEPVRQLALTGSVWGVRYPDEGLHMLRAAGLAYRGWIANADVPAAFARHRVTVHIPRKPYVAALPGIPTIRVFEALACGIPLICAPWQDEEGLFRAGRDFLMVHDGEEMRLCLRRVLQDRDLAASLSRNGLDTIRSRHTCRHRVDELLQILRWLGRSEAHDAILPMEAAQ